MGFFSGMLKAAVDVVTLPIAVAADVVTLGQKSFTADVIEHVEDDIREIFE
jgi:hypothetical protein